MKITTDRRVSEGPHFSPYPPMGGASPHSFHPPALPPLSARSSMGGGGGTKRQSTSSPSHTDRDGGTEYKVARAISSCTRCRSRKQKCDGKLPACSACERAKVECIGFDAISKTNISRNYLYSLEQEVATLRAQVAALTADNHDSIGQVKRGIAASASQAISSFAPSLTIDPSLTSESEHMRSPWDSPGGGYRRHSDFPFPPSSLGGGDSPRSPYIPNRTPTLHHPTISATSLTRMVHDAAWRTGHALDHGAVLNPPGGSVTGSEKGDLDSPAASGAGALSNNGGPEPTSPQDDLTPHSHSGGHHPPSASPLGTGSSTLGGKAFKRRLFAIPPLPPQPAVERLIAAYTDFVGVTAPMIHVPSLVKQIAKMREGRDVEESDVFVVMMILALSTMASSRFVDPPDELRACSEAFHAEAMKHLDAVFEEQSYVGLQAILLLVWYSLLNPEKGSIWFLVGLATRTCVDLGFHNERNALKDNLDNLEVDMRRRLFWCTYKMDRLLSTSLGRPPSLPDGFVNVQYPSAIEDDDIHPGSYGPISGDPCPYKAVFLHTLKLRRLQSRILHHTYGIWGENGPRQGPPEEWFDEIFEQLKNWLATTPEPRGTVSSEGFAISFHNAVLLLFRPSPGNPRPGRKALSTVLASSSYIIRIYRRMQLNNRISWLWMTSHFSFMAGVSFLYAFFNLYSMGGGPGVPSLAEAQMDIESCTAVLAYLAPRVPSAGACHDTMQTMSKAILDQLTASDSRRSSGTSPGRQRHAPPVSSSRDDPLPNDRFPAPLPPIPLPYELSLLDNVFVNPMAAHNKASDYTNGKQARSKVSVKTEQGSMSDMTTNNGLRSTTYGAPPQGFPPGAFGGNIGVTGTPNNESNMSGLNPYAMAAQVNQNNSTNSAFSLASMLAQNAGGVTTGTTGDLSTTGPVQANGVAGNDPANFDILNFLMAEEGGLGGSGNWDALDVPADFSLWS